MADDLERPFDAAYAEMQDGGLCGGIQRPPAGQVASVKLSVLDEPIAAFPTPPYPINLGTPAPAEPTQVECPHCRQMVPTDKKPCTSIAWCNEITRPKW
jgi:hypothetical protein